MKEIKLTNLSIRNFKGITTLEISDIPDVLNIRGDNATGKTSIWDAANWLLFGKDSQNRQDFNIKPLNPDGSVKHKIDVEVEGVFNVSGKKQILKRVFQEKWVTRRGSAEVEFDGNTTNFYINETPKAKKEYEDFVNEMCPENLFRLLTSPPYFPTLLKWEDQREMLFQIAGEASDQDIAKDNEKFQELLDRMSGESFKAYKTRINSQKKKIKDRLVYIPARIDEVSRSMPEKQDWESVVAELTGKQGEYKSLVAQIEDKSKLSDEEFKRREGLQKELYERKSDIDRLRHEIAAKNNNALKEYEKTRDELSESIDWIERTKNKYYAEIEQLKSDIGQYEKHADTLRQQWFSEDKRTLAFSENEFTCPTCKRKFETEDITAKQKELTGQFNQDKAENLKEINRQGQRNKERIKILETEIQKQQQNISVAEKDIEKSQKALNELREPVYGENTIEEIPEYERSLKRIQEINQILSASVNLPDVDKLKERRDELSTEIDRLRSLLHDKDEREKDLARIAELEKEQKRLALELAELEREEFIMQEFDYAKIGAVEQKINSMFKIAKFKLFNVQVNGEVVETCVATLDGVPYPDANSAGKIQMGIDIINTLSEYHGVRAPIWIDNREGVVRIPDCKSQIFNLYVVEGLKTLEINFN